MKKLLLFSLFISLAVISYAQKEPQLLGYCAASDLTREPYATWFKPGYDNYIPTADVVAQLKKAGPEKFTIKIVFGSWCGDSRRELPRMLKVLDAAGFTKDNVQLLGVYDSMAVYKQGPNREEKGLNIYRVPAFLVYQKGKEVGRINEYPVESLERDLAKILQHETYTPNYRGYQQINVWLANGVLRDPNINPRGLAQQIRNDVSRETDLNSCGYVLLMRNDITEAINVFRINASLYPQSANCFDSLGEAFMMAGMKEESKSCYQRVLEIDPQHANAKAQLEKLNKN